jgi:hypothetical protein
VWKLKLLNVDFNSWVKTLFPISINMGLLIILLAVLLALVGFTGGIWFWQKMAESPLWEQIRRWLKVLGVCGALSFFASVIYLVWMMETQPAGSILKLIFTMNTFSWFLCFYVLGYDVSILRHIPEGIKDSNRKEISPFKYPIKLGLLLRVLFTALFLIAPAVGLLLLSMISKYVFMMWVAGIVGFTMGFSIWEHLKETGVITGTFKHRLVILSFIATIIIGCTVGYGFYVDFWARNPESIQILLMSMVLFIGSMAGYMLGLCVVAFRAR